MNEAASEVGVAAFSSDGGRSRSVELQANRRVRGASVVKPLLAWTAATLSPFVDDPEEWRTLARPAIVTSDNVATAALWSRAGGERLLASLNERVGVRWRVSGEGEHPSLRLMVTAHELANAYGALASDRADASAQIRKWMREVPEVQTFGVRRVASDTLGVSETSVGVKCGWFGGERVHAVVVVEVADRTVGAAVTTSRVPDGNTQAAVQDAIGDDAKLAAAHDAISGPTIRAAVERALLACHEL